MAKIVPSSRDERATVRIKTKTDKKPEVTQAWWRAGSKAAVTEQLIATATFLKDNNQSRYRQAAIYARLYGNLPLFGWVGSHLSRMSTANQLPIDRPTMSVITSCIDTLVSRVSQSRPRPVFLTDNGDYKQRNIAKQMNCFIAGEFYQTKAYQLGELILRDAAVLGTGCFKVLRTPDNKVALERTLFTELMVDPNDSLYGEPRQLYQFKLVDRSVLAESFPEHRSAVEKAEQGYPDSGTESGKTISDQVIVVEGWHLPSGKDATDGRHTIACSAGILLDEPYTKDYFPFVFLHYSPRMLGFWGQGLAEQLMGTQVEINKLLMTISSSINLVGVPRVFLEKGSKVVKAHLNNNVGSIVEYSGTKPIYEVAPCVPQELYAQLQRLVDYAYQQSGISTLAAASQKPAGLTSGTALREYDDLQTDRFAALVRRYDQVYIELAHQIIELAKEIAEDTGSYQTVYPNKDGTREIDLPGAKILDNPFVIQCFDASSLPRDPAGRLQKIVEMMQAGLISPQEGRRMLDYPDLEQVEKLANAPEERVLQILDDIVDSGKYTPPDPFMDLQLALQLTTQYYNLYSSAKLDADKGEKLRTFATQVQALIAQATQPPPQPPTPMAAPTASPQSELLPNVQGAA